MKHNENSVDDPKRRKLMTVLGSILGVASANQLLDGNAFSIAMAHAESNDKATSKPKVFNVQQLATLKQVCQTVIPATDTLGAGDIDTQNFIDNQLHHCFESSAQASLVGVVELIEASAQSKHQESFAKLDASKTHAMLVALDSATNGFSKKQTEGFKFLKSLIVFGYYTSEIGASQELKHERVPGGFKGSVPLADVGAAWGSLDFF